jgi:hypothetical protein
MNTKSPEVCSDPHRRLEIRAAGMNGIDYLEVADDQLMLIVYFFRRAPENLRQANVVLQGGVRIQNIHVQDLRFCSADDPEEDDCIKVFVDRAGDFSTYTIALREVDDAGNPTASPLTGFDPLYAQLDFSFRAGLSSNLDCASQPLCETAQPPSPEIDYLAKDYTSFRRLILDRLSLIMPEWQEQHVPDVGIALVEILAYHADRLSYFQDAVATEAYLNTARRRISVRRHVKLLDYAMHEGCNARTWIHVETSKDATVKPMPGAPLEFLAGDPAVGAVQVFEPIAKGPCQFYESHNRINLYTWGNRQCCLPTGSTSATFEDNREKPLHLAKGDCLLLEELCGPHTGTPTDADPSHRHIVRLTNVENAVDPLGNQPIVQVEWSAADALPFPLCLSSVAQPPHCNLIRHVSAARGNLLLADHGEWVLGEPLGIVPLATSTQVCEGEHRVAQSLVKPGPFYPHVQTPWLTFRQPLPANSPAAELLTQDPRRTLPEVRLRSIAPYWDGSIPLFTFEELNDPRRLAVRLVAQEKDAATEYLHSRFSRKGLAALADFDPAKPLANHLASDLLAEMNQFVRMWSPRYDNFKSGPLDLHYVVEMDDDGIGWFRFGDGQLGRRPEPGECFAVDYRVGNGVSGNVPSETITQIVPADGGVHGLVLTARNPLPSHGGMARESIDAVRAFAPGAFLNQLERAIVPEDYATLAECNPKVQRAAATLVWTGTRYEVRVAIDPLGIDNPDPGLLREILVYLYRYRRVGHDLTVVQARYVPVQLDMTVHLLPDYLQAHVRTAVLDALGTRQLPGGGRGFFHPDNLTFGESIYLSRILTVAQAIPGVENVTVTSFQRLFEEPKNEIASGVLAIGPLEVAQLDNDPVFPERGLLRLQLRGGR